MKKTLEFLNDLRLNNNREWFAANRHRYEHALATVRNATGELIQYVAEADPRAAMLSVADCTYRIYRDVRFSSDKSPYKTHIGIFINPPAGKKSLTCGYYFHIEPDNCFAAAGTVCLPSKIITAIRRSIVDNIDEYRSIVEDPEFRELYPRLGENPVKTAPKGIPRDWPWIQYVRPRDFVASTASGCNPRLWLDDPDKTRRLIAQAFRFNRFINFTICEELGIED